MPAEPISAPARKNINTVRELEAEFVRRRSLVERATDTVTRFIGSFRFLVFQAAVVLAWAGVNVGLVAGVEPFDPFPYPFLNFAVGFEAILLSTVVLMTQNRQTQQAEHWGHLQLQISLLAEQESTKMLQMLRLICAKLGLHNVVRDPELAEMIRTTHVEELARELEKAREETAEPGKDEDQPHDEHGNAARSEPEA